jgi:hypothetical protein
LTTPPPPVEPEFEMVRAALNWGTSVAALKEIAMMFNLSGGAQKMEVLFNWIRDSPHVTKISETEFEYRRPKTGASAGGKKIPMWILLTPEEVPSVDGVDMGTGAQISFFGPTNKENAVSGTRSNFLTSSANEFRGRSSGQSEIRRGRTEKPSCHHPGKMGIHPITAAVFFPPPSLVPGQRITSIPNSHRRGSIGARQRRCMTQSRCTSSRRQRTALNGL